MDIEERIRLKDDGGHHQRQVHEANLRDFGV